MACAEPAVTLAVTLPRSGGDAFTRNLYGISVSDMLTC